ncbi:MAG: sugar transferase [Bacteroidales bacterium]|nr:sugar transferase [Bacteroidales bacterium]
MNIEEKLSNRAQFVRMLLTIGTVVLTIVAYFATIACIYHDSYPDLTYILNPNFLLTCVFITIYWSILDTWLRLNEVYRSRSYGYIVLFHVVENVIGIMLLSFTSVLFGMTVFGRDVLLLFGAMSTILSILFKVAFYIGLRHMRKKGFNNKTVLFICDKAGDSLLSLLYKRYEWGYKIVGAIGDSYIANKYNGKFPVYLDNEVELDKLITQNVDEVIYAKDYDNSQDIIRIIDVCNEIGVTFRLYSPFLNRLSKNTQLRYFDTNAVITVSNTPTNYVGMLFKRIFDIVFSSGVILVGFPFFFIVALLIKIDSRGPVFFRQKRSGLKGKVFRVFKFRTMVANAEDLREDLEKQNEMDGPAFKIANDPRITRIGRILRKTGIDEFPQFLNVFVGDMSIVGPRPPIPTEVEKYERWQLRRLAMKPGITCLWQVSRERNKISFDDWMNLDMQYIDNWSLSLDMVIVFKTIQTMFRADGN